MTDRVVTVRGLGPPSNPAPSDTTYLDENTGQLTLWIRYKGEGALHPRRPAWF